MRIDAHHHFWRYTPAEFGWIDDAMAAIRRDFGPADLARELSAARIDGVVSVQARQSVEETRWLLELAARHAFVRGVVGWVDLRSPAVAEQLAEFAGAAKFRGVRHVVQGEADPAFLDGAEFNRGVRALRAQRLTYDVLIVARQLPAAIRFVDRHPEQVFVLDHIAKPAIRAGEVEPWRGAIRELARRPNVYCKVSGMVTEADYGRWTEAQLWPYFDTVLEAFGPRRLMVGTDWPVCLVACGYARWIALVERWVVRLSAAEQARVLGGTAVEAYQL